MSDAMNIGRRSVLTGGAAALAGLSPLSIADMALAADNGERISVRVANTAGNMTLPTVADLEAEISSATKVNAAFDFYVVNIDATTDDVTVYTNTGWTLVGVMQVDNATSGHFRARKTGDGAWTCYRVS